jgi:pimeloyl-ACP methyl ester carboxylesterase
VDLATRTVDFDGHRLAYRVNGRGPALVIVSQYWRSEDEVHVRLLGDRWAVFHITPVGYGKSDRVPGYAGEALAPQVLAVLDDHGIDRFVVWGYSAGGAMAACVARATTRVAAMICGGFALFDHFTPATMRQLDRRLRPNHASRSLWPWVNAFEWTDEVGSMSCACLVYWGSEDRQMAAKLRRSQGQLALQHVDFVEFVGPDHGACNSRETLESTVVPAIKSWLTRRVALPA